MSLDRTITLKCMNSYTGESAHNCTLLPAQNPFTVTYCVPPLCIKNRCHQHVILPFYFSLCWTVVMPAQRSHHHQTLQLILLSNTCCINKVLNKLRNWQQFHKRIFTWFFLYPWHNAVIADDDVLWQQRDDVPHGLVCANGETQLTPGDSLQQLVG